MSELSEVLAVLAHEMRTPIAAILGYQELLADGIYGTVDERGKEPLDRIAYSARQLLHLIDGVQEISSPGKPLSMQTETFDPGPLLHQCLENSLADAHGRSVTVEAHVDVELPELVGDRDRFCRAVDLALAAAIKTSHSATLPVHVKSNHGGILLTIERTGLVPEHDTPAASANGKLTGAGLRLAIVREIARQMRGDLQLTASQEGTTVTVKFAGAAAQ